MRAPAIRHPEVLAQLIDETDPDEAEELTHRLCRAPRNRAELREFLGNLPRSMRLATMGGRHNEVRYGGTA